MNQKKILIIGQKNSEYIRTIIAKCVEDDFVFKVETSEHVLLGLMFVDKINGDKFMTLFYSGFVVDQPGDAKSENAFETLISIGININTIIGIAEKKYNELNLYAHKKCTSLSKLIYFAN